MSLRAAPYYWLVCDAPNCGVKSTAGAEFTAWSDVDGALEDARGSEWKTIEPPKPGDWRPGLPITARHYCPDHEGNACDRCGAYDDTPYAGERDYLCVACATLAGMTVCHSCGMPDETHSNECEADT